MADWRLIATVPESPRDSNGSPMPIRALVWSAMIGIHIADVGTLGETTVACIPSFSGEGIEDWNVTHWQPLPEPPTAE